MELLESLENAPDETSDVEGAWAAEIERRAGRILNGESHGTSWGDVLRRAEANIAKR